MLLPFLKRLWFGMRGQDPAAMVVVLRCGDPVVAARVESRMRELLPDREITVVEDFGEGAGQQWLRLRRRLEGQRVALFAAPRIRHPLVWAAAAIAPHRLLLFRSNLDRFHITWRQPVASLLFLRGVPLDRIHLRPWWMGTSERSSLPEEWRYAGGRGFRNHRPRVAILSPYLPWPASHGGAVRIWNLLRECAAEFDIVFFGFDEGQSGEELQKVAAHCAALFTATQPRYREPRWSTWLPPEVREYHNPRLHSALQAELQRLGVSLLQAEYTQMAAYGPDVLVEHDVMQDLMWQVRERQDRLAAWWDWLRWRSFERTAVNRARSVVVMSEKDRDIVAGASAAVIPNGVDLRRFAPVPEPQRPGLLFVGSFRHFPNLEAWRFFRQAVWPLVKREFPELRLVCVAGPDQERFWPEAETDPQVDLRGFVEDVVPLYREATVVVVPTLVSAGTNLKALEAMAMERAMVSTSSGVAGLGLEHGRSVWIAEEEREFAAGIGLLLNDPARRRSIAGEARRLAVERYGWQSLAERQLEVWRELLPAGTTIQVRRMTVADLPAVRMVQESQVFAAQWPPEDYLKEEAWVAVLEEKLAGFAVARRIPGGELEILNVAVASGSKRRGVGSRLLRTLLGGPEQRAFLEVRASNEAAQRLYATHGFSQVGVRRGYYRNPDEDGIVMQLQKW